jgi:hypothetical protein
VDGALVGAGSPRPKLHTNKQGECHTMALPFTLKSIILRQKKNYGNSNISPSKNINLQKIL